MRTELSEESCTNWLWVRQSIFAPIYASVNGLAEHVFFERFTNAFHGGVLCEDPRD